MSALLLAAGFAFEIASWILLLRSRFDSGWGCSAASSVLWGMFWAGQHVTGMVIFQAACTALYIVLWWNWWRRNRKRALALLGAKSRALITRLVASLQPGPGQPPLRAPVPAGTQ